MTEPTRPFAAPPPTASTAEFVATFGIVLVTIVVFLFIDSALARVDQQESRAHAANLYRDGQALMARGDAREASDRFASAVAAERSNPQYALGLAQAMLADHRLDDAHRVLEGVLERAQSDGPANLTMAHVLVAEGRVEDAKSYFHRAIYGRWGPDSAARRTAAQLELVDLLARRHESTEMLAELLPLEAAAVDVPQRRRLGHLFVAAGAPERGAALLREVVRTNPRDADAYAGLGDAALALGNYRSARADFLLAAQLSAPSQFAERLALTDTLLALDPTDRRLDEVARMERSLRLLSSTLAAVERCGSASPALESLADSARRVRSADPEGLQSLAGDLWTARPPSCEPAASPLDRALPLLHAKLSLRGR
jgi:tetratricopeptide (TPR) repeat protein